MKLIHTFLLFIVIISTSSCNTKTSSHAYPDWSAQAVFYQIFPERFNNGDASNDPQIPDLKGSWPHGKVQEWAISPWISDWYKLQSWELNNGKGFYYNAQLRRYGGDLQGIINKLDYLTELGISAIYINPIFESPSLHKYDAAFYHHVDDNFGPDPEKDRNIIARENPSDPESWQWTTADSLFLQLLQQAHKKEIRVIIDGVFNHVGLNFWAFRDVADNQQNSVYKDWFTINSWDDPETAENEFDYECWAGAKQLPEFREDENGLVPGPREHVHAVVKRWMDPNNDGNPSDGIDGWRLDVAEKVSINFWREFRNWVKEINPQAYITGEIWWEDWKKNKMFNAAPWLQGDVFDGVMNYRWGRAARMFVIDSEYRISAQGFVDSVQAVFKDYGNHVYSVMNMVDSHDMERLSSQVVNRDYWPDHGANMRDNPEYDVRKPTKIEQLKQKLIVGMQLASPGIPVIYYGDEAGMWGADDPDCRKPMVWPDVLYEPEQSHPFGKKRPEDAVFFDNDLFSWYQKLIKIRRENKVLSSGNIEYFLINDDRNILGYKRSNKTQSIYVLINNNDTENLLQLNLQEQGVGGNTLTDLINGTKLVAEGNLFHITFQPYQIYILK